MVDDDSLVLSEFYGVGGIAGAIMLSFFIRDSRMEEACAAAEGSWNRWQHPGVQTAAVIIAISYAAVVTLIEAEITRITVSRVSGSQNNMILALLQASVISCGHTLAWTSPMWAFLR